MAKVSYIVTDMSNMPMTDDLTGKVREHPTEAKALAAAKKQLANGCEDEVWVWRLSHVVSKPEVEPVIDKVRG